MGAYARSEVLRTFRNTRFLVFSLVFPLVLFVIIAGPNRHEDILGVPIPLYFMGGMTAFGSMMAVVSSGVGSPPSARSAGTASCGSRRCGPAPTSPPRCSAATCWPA